MDFDERRKKYEEAGQQTHVCLRCKKQFTYDVISQENVERDLNDHGMVMFRPKCPLCTAPGG